MIYEYECEKHGVFEVEQSVKDSKLEFCPHCAKENIQTVVKKLISKSSFVLNGNCWARDNYS